MKLKLFCIIIIVVLLLSNCTSRSSLINDRGVKIGDVCWATRNVDKPGTFAAKPQDPGMFYQWNSKIGWSVTDPILSTENDSVWIILNNEPSKWFSENDPCPEGWRLPTRSELESLIKLHSQWKENGQLFANKLFLPAVGHRNGKTIWRRKTNGYYWSRTPENNSTTVYSFHFTNNYPSIIYPEYFRGNGLSVRCVKK